jgi:hypothetical protein
LEITHESYSRRIRGHTGTAGRPQCGRDFGGLPQSHT